MDPTTLSITALKIAAIEPITCPALCPVCGGFLIPLRTVLRCQRCSFTMCDGCEGGTEME
jgi:hypothetical protein